MRSYRSSPSYPCPVCGRTKDGDCAIDETADGLKVRCHSYLEDEQVPSFVYRGKTECGTWGLYFSVPVDKPKAVRPAGRKEFFYPDSKGFPLAKVVRVDDGEGHKKFSQWYWYWSREQVWEPSLPAEYQKRLHLYRIADDLNRSAIRDGERILLVEGEGKVDLLLSMGIPATCSIGGAGKWRRYGYPNYLEDLRGAQVVLVPDRDSKGLSHMEDVAKDFPDAEWLFPFSDSPLWNRLPEKGGLDIADWIADFKLSRGQVLAEIGKRPVLASNSSTVESHREEKITLEAVLAKLQAIFTIDDEASQLWQLGLLSKSVGRPVRDLLNIWEAYQDSHLRFLPVPLCQLFARPELERRWLIGGLIPNGTVIGMIASGGTGKTLLAYDLVKAIASGQPWNGFPVHQGKCLIVQTDEQWTDTVDRLDIAGFRELDPDSVHFVEHWQFAHLARLGDYVREQGIKFCVIDSFTSTNRRSAAEEKDTAYAKCLYDLRDLASQTGCTFLVLHHTNKAGGSRGTTAFEDNVSEVWFLTREQLEGFTPNHRQLEIKKSRSGCTGKYKLFLDVDDYSWKFEGDVDESYGSKPLMQRVLEYLQQSPGLWFEPEELTYYFPDCKSRDAIRKHLERLRKKGLVEADDRVKESSNASGKIRYKVYCYPSPSVESIKTFYTANFVQQDKFSISENQNVQQGKTLSQSQSCLLDNPKINGTLVQQAEDSPEGNPVLLDNDRCTHGQNREFSQNGCIKNTYTSRPTSQSFAVGDRVRYVGQGENGLFTLKGIWRETLTIVAIKDDRAEVSSPKWVTTQLILLKDLHKSTHS